MAEKTRKSAFTRVKSGMRSVLSKLNPLRETKKTVVDRSKLATEALVGRIRGNKLDEYDVGQAHVLISEDEGVAYYEVSEPSLNHEEMEIYRDLLENFFHVLNPDAATAENPMKYIEGAIWKSADELGLLDEVREEYSKYRYFIERDGLGYGKLQAPMDDPKVEEITITGFGVPARVIHREYTEYDWLTTNIAFRSEMELRNYVQRLAQQLDESLTAAVPIVDATTRQGDRVSLTFGDEVTHPGSTLTIRKHLRKPLSLAKLVENGTLSPQAAAYLWQVLDEGGYPMIIGEISGGKTTLLNALLASVSPNRKMTTLEETLELKLPHENWHRFHTRLRRFGLSGEHDITLGDLVKAVMRHRPDYLAVGEVRGREIKALTHVASLGHSAACTLHSDSAEKALIRMQESLMDLTREELLLVWCFPHTRKIRKPSGKVVRRVVDVKELNRGSSGEPELTEVISYDPHTDSHSPTSLEDIFQKSVRLQDKVEARRSTPDQMIKNLGEKKNFLEKLVEHNELSFEDYTRRVREYYSER